MSLRAGSRRRRIVATATIMTLLAVGLTGCNFLFGTSQSYEDTVAWLEEQPILTSVVKITEDEVDFETRGEIRGELDPSATSAEIEVFAMEAVAFLDTQSRSIVNVYLGHGDINFAVDDTATTREAIPIWQQVEILPAIRGALVSGDFVTARGLRADVGTMIGELSALGVGYQVDGLNDEAAFQTDVRPGAYTGHNDERVVGSVRAESDCTPATGVLEIAVDLVLGGSSGILNLCKFWELKSLDPIGQAAIDLRVRLNAAGVTALPVTMSEVRLVEYDTRQREVNVTAGSAEALDVLLAIDAADDFPDDASFILDEHRDLTLSDYDGPTSRLSRIVLGSPALAALNNVTLAGQDYSVNSPPGGLTTMLDEAELLDAATPIYDYITMSVGGLILVMPRDGSSSVPEATVRAAAVALSDNGAWRNRLVEVSSPGASFTIDSGDAEELGGSAASSKPLTWFRDEWVSLHP